MQVLLTEKKIDNIIEKGKKQIDNYNVIFFDVFDTLVCRDCLEPIDLFDYVEERYNEVHKPIHGFRKKRVDAQKKCTKNIATPTLDQIYNYISTGNVEELKELEIEAEISLSTKNYIGYMLYHYAKEKGKKIVAVSDMYLSSSIIQRILFKSGYDITTIIVSCEHGVEKYRGGLFQKAMLYAGVSNNSVVHFGDNLISDVLGSKMAGIASFWLPGRRKLEYLNDCPVKPFVTNRILFLDNRVQQVGYEVLGPIIVGYCQWLHQKLQNEGYYKALFCARDMKQTLDIYLRMYPEDKSMIHYFFVSVKSLEKPYLASLGRDTSNEAELQLENLKKYIKDLDCQKKVAMIDSGINGRSQKMLMSILNEECEIHGLYMRISRFFTNNVSDSESCAFLYEDKPDIRYFISASFFESLIAATHGRTLGWEKDVEGKVKPILGNDNTDNQLQNDFQHGIQQFALDYLSSPIKEVSIEGRWIQESFLKFAFYPCKEDVEAMENMSGGNESYQEIVLRKDKERSLLKGLQKTFWKGGYLCDSFPHIYKLIVWVYLHLDGFYLNHFEYHGRWDPE